MSNKRNRTLYYRGKKGKKFGIWNNMKKEFQFGICEDSPMLAEARLFYMIGDDARKWRFETREIPQNLLSTITTSETVITTTKRP